MPTRPPEPKCLRLREALRPPGAGRGLPAPRGPLASRAPRRRRPAQQARGREARFSRPRGAESLGDGARGVPSAGEAGDARGPPPAARGCTGLGAAGTAPGRGAPRGGPRAARTALTASRCPPGPRSGSSWPPPARSQRSPLLPARPGPTADARPQRPTTQEPTRRGPRPGRLRPLRLPRPRPLRRRSLGFRLRPPLRRESAPPESVFSAASSSRPSRHVTHLSPPARAQPKPARPPALLQRRLPAGACPAEVARRPFPARASSPRSESQRSPVYSLSVA